MQRTKTKRKLLSVIVSLAMVVSMLPAGVMQVSADDAYTISGTVTVNGQTAGEGVSLDLYNADDRKVDSVSTDANGAYTFTVSEGGTYHIVPTGGYAFNEGTDDPGEKEITVSNQNLTNVSVELMEVVTISGKVTDIEGNALKNVDMLIMRGDSAVDRNGTNTASDGTYKFYIKKDTSNTSEIKVSALKSTVEGSTYNAAERTVTSGALSSNISDQDIQMTKADTTEYYLVINGTQVTDKNQDDVLGDGGSVVFKPYNDAGEWSPQLILTNANLDTLSAKTAVIVSDIDDMYMVLNGKNTINVPQGYNVDGIAASYLYIIGEGGGSLTITNPNQDGDGIEVRNSLNIQNGVTLNIDAGAGITAGESVYISGLNTIDIDADLYGIYAKSYLDIMISSEVNITSEAHGMISQAITISGSNVTVSAGNTYNDGLAMINSVSQVGTTSPSTFIPEAVSVKASTDSSGKNAATYDDSKQGTYKYISTSAEYVADMTIPLTLKVTNESGEKIPATEFKFVVESYPGQDMTDTQKQQLQEMFDKFAEITVTPAKVNKEGTYTQNYLNIKLTDGARMTAGMYGMKVSLAAVPEGWESGGEQYQMIFDYDDQGNFTVTSFEPIASSKVTTQSSGATFTVAYKGSDSDSTSKASVSKTSASKTSATKTGDDMYPALWIMLALIAVTCIAACARRIKTNKE